MIRLNLSIVRGVCAVPGCENAAGMFGVCGLHEADAIRGHFDKAVSDGICSKEMPPCFPNHTEWREYTVASVLCRNQSERKAAPIDFCRDCTPAHKARMMDEGRCTHHEVVFIRSDRHQGDVIGVGMGKLSTQWESAMMGMYGPVVKLPPAEVVEETLAKIAIEKAPKKRGPRFKKDREQRC